MFFLNIFFIGLAYYKRFLVQDNFISETAYFEDKAGINYIAINV